MPDIPWVKPDGKSVRAGGGFAIDNCLLEKRDGRYVKVDCLFPVAVQGLVVDEDSGNETRAFPDGFFGQMRDASDSVRSIVDDGRLMVLRNPGIWPSQWYVVSRKDGQFKSSNEDISGDNFEFFASCRNTKSRLGVPHAEMREVVQCQRKILPEGLYVSYRFTVEGDSPRLDEVLDLDQSVTNKLVEMRCDER